MKTFSGLGSKELRLAMLGMVDGNGHPYSWSAIFNGFEAEEMAKCPFPTIPDYLSKEPEENLSIPGAKVTHVWTDDPADAPKVAAASRVPNVVKRAEDVIGEVDAVIVATDKGHEHVDRCRPFVEAGLPVFVDKPLVDNEPDLQQFRRWVINENRPILSSSSMRYCKEYMPYRVSTHNLGALRYVTITTPKTWERYGIHALEGMYPIVGPGFASKDSAIGYARPQRGPLEAQTRSGRGGYCDGGHVRQFWRSHAVRDSRRGVCQEHGFVLQFQSAARGVRGFPALGCISFPLLGDGGTDEARHCGDPQPGRGRTGNTSRRD